MPSQVNNAEAKQSKTFKHTYVHTHAHTLARTQANRTRESSAGKVFMNTGRPKFYPQEPTKKGRHGGTALYPSTVEAEMAATFGAGWPADLACLVTSRSIIDPCLKIKKEPSRWYPQWFQ